MSELGLRRLAPPAATALLLFGLWEWLARSGTDLAGAANYVLRKNRELYRRLAQ